MTTKIRKHDLVYINPAQIHEGTTQLRLQRPITATEVTEWYASDLSKGMNCAGETKLPPTCSTVIVDVNEAFTVVRSRCRVKLGYGNPSTGMTELLTACGETAYIKQAMLINAADKI